MSPSTMAQTEGTNSGTTVGYNSVEIDFELEKQRMLKAYEWTQRKVSSTKGKFPSNLTPPKKKRKKR